MIIWCRTHDGRQGSHWDTGAGDRHLGGLEATGEQTADVWRRVPGPLPAHSIGRMVTLKRGDGGESSECQRRAVTLEKLATVSHRRELLELEELADVGSARAAGATWAEIGVALRVSEHAVSKKYSPVLKPKVLSRPFVGNRKESGVVLRHPLHRSERP